MESIPPPSRWEDQKDEKQKAHASSVKWQDCLSVNFLEFILPEFSEWFLYYLFQNNNDIIVMFLY